MFGARELRQGRAKRDVFNGNKFLPKLLITIL